MSTGTGEEQESGKTLRERFEEALQENRKLKEEIVEGRAQTLISTKGYTYVKPTDLVGVPLADLEKKATEIEAAKAAEATDLLERTLKARGLDDDQVAGMIAQLTGDNTESSDAAAQSLLRQTSRVTGPTAPTTPANVFGQDKILNALEKKDKRAKR